MLTEKTIAKIQPSNKLQKIHDSEYLFLHVHPSGLKKWVFRCYKPTDTTRVIGAYPYISLVGARRMRDTLAERIKNKEPLISQSFADFSKTWASKKQWAKTTRRRNEYLLSLATKYLQAHLKDITLHDCVHLLQRIEAKGTIETAKRTIAIVAEILEEARISGLVSQNVAHGLSRIATKKQSKNLASLQNITEIKSLLRKVNNLDANETVKSCFLFVALTFVRLAEARQLQWCNVEESAIRIPSWRMKSRREHLVPITPHVQKILDTMKKKHGHTPYVFFSATAKSGLLSAKNFYDLIAKCGYAGQHTMHGFRHFASTYINEHSPFAPRVVELQLAHKVAGVEGVYNKSQLLKERAEMLIWYHSQLLD